MEPRQIGGARTEWRRRPRCNGGPQTAEIDDGGMLHHDTPAVTSPSCIRIRFEVRRRRCDGRLRISLLLVVARSHLLLDLPTLCTTLRSYC